MHGAMKLAHAAV